MQTNLNFGQALEALKQGKKISRNGWNGKGMYVSLCTPEINKTRPEILPYLEMKTADEKYIPWLASQTDVMGEDWCILD